MAFSLNPKELLRRFTEIDDTPHAIALGAAIGMFYGFTLLFGLKTLLSLVTARIFRGHMVAAAVTVTLMDLLLPILPAILAVELHLGNRLLGRRLELDPSALHHFKLADLLKWTTYLRDGFPMLLGSLLVGAAAGLATYAVVFAWAGGRKMKEPEA
jgi:uncharacterized protein (DUF2062 family)